jgi:hypothetical protein
LKNKFSTCSARLACTTHTHKYFIYFYITNKYFAKNRKLFFDLFNGLRWEVIVCFVDIGGIVDHCCLHFLVIIQIFLRFCASTVTICVRSSYNDMSLLVIAARPYMRVHYDNGSQYFFISLNIFRKADIYRCANMFLLWIRKDIKIYA